jgi:TRAP-type C4-dicarboxylate transport system substrate-binding protein
MKAIKRLSIAVALATATAVQVPAFAVEWDFATANSPGNYQTKIDEQFAAEVAAATHDAVKINVHPGGQLGFKGPEMLATVRDGLVPIGSFQMTQQAGLVPVMGASSLPYVVSGFDEMKVFRTTSKTFYDDVFKKYNQKLLFVVPWPSQNVFSKAELSDASAFKPMKIRTTDRAGSDFFRSLGASPAQIPWGEVVPALATGVIDSVSTSTSSAVDGQFWEFLKYCNVVNWQTNFEVVTVNLDAWNALSAEDQKRIEDIATRLEPVFWDKAKAEDSKNMETLKAHGMQVVTPPATVLDFMSAKGKPTWAIFQESVPAAKPLLKQYLTDVGK